MRRALPEAYARADWRRVDQLYRQFAAIANDPEEENVLPDILMGSLAESLTRVFAHYDGQEQQFMEDLFLIWSEIEGRSQPNVDVFRGLYSDERLERFPAYNPPGNLRRRPKPFETSIETCRHLMDLNRVRNILAPLQTYGILGGSVSYGRFFNVCGATIGKPSDTDLLLVLPDYNHLLEVLMAIEMVEGIDKESLKECTRRANLFPAIIRSNPHCIFSHKLKFWEDVKVPFLFQYQIPWHYQLSLHIFSWSEFEFMILKDMPVLTGGKDGTFVRELCDYRDTSPQRLDNQRSFSGIDFSVPLHSKKVNGGFISCVRVCHIQNDRFYPGLHQNLVLPQFEIRWEGPQKRLYLPLLSFKWKILERLREEQRLRPFEVQTLSLSHTRSAVFAPHITRRADRE